MKKQEYLQPQTIVSSLHLSSAFLLPASRGGSTDESFSRRGWEDDEDFANGRHRRRYDWDDDEEEEEEDW